MVKPKKVLVNHGNHELRLGVYLAKNLDNELQELMPETALDYIFVDGFTHYDRRTKAKIKYAPLCDVFDDIDISHFSFREYGENEPKRYYFWSEENGLESINLIDGDIVVKRPLYAHFQKRMIKCPEFKLVDSFYVIPNQLVIGEKISKQELVEVTRNKFYWEYIKSTMLKKLKKEKWTLEFIRHKLRMKSNE